MIMIFLISRIHVLDFDRRLHVDLVKLRVKNDMTEPAMLSHVPSSRAFFFIKLFPQTRDTLHENVDVEVKF